jgi:acyl-CoA thioesterase
MPGSHPYDKAIDLDTIEDNVRRGRTHPEWANMVGPFGGITAAAMVRAIETHQHWVVELSQNGEVKTTATALFAIRRDTWADTEARPPSAPPPEEVAPGGLGAAIAWGARYDMRFVAGSVPETDPQPSPTSTTTLWVRDSAQRRVDYPALAALSDIFYPRVFLRRGGYVPAGTISLTTYFHADQEQLDALGGDYVLATAHANRFSRGYFDQSAQLWTREGALLATTQQIVYFKG